MCIVCIVFASRAVRVHRVSIVCTVRVHRVCITRGVWVHVWQCPYSLHPTPWRTLLLHWNRSASCTSQSLYLILTCSLPLSVCLQSTVHSTFLPIEILRSMKTLFLFLKNEKAIQFFKIEISVWELRGALPVSVWILDPRLVLIPDFTFFLLFHIFTVALYFSYCY